MSKVLKMKAIHNMCMYATPLPGAVVTMSKVLKMKAIHNNIGTMLRALLML